MLPRLIIVLLAASASAFVPHGPLQLQRRTSFATPAVARVYEAEMFGGSTKAKPKAALKNAAPKKAAPKATKVVGRVVPTKQVAKKAVKKATPKVSWRKRASVGSPVVKVSILLACEHARGRRGRR